MKKCRTSKGEKETTASRSVAIQMPLRLLEMFGRIEESFFELCVEAGQQVLGTMMEEDRERLCGPKWQHNSEREALRGGSVRGEVTLGGRRIALQRLRARSVDGSEVRLPSFAWAAKRDPLERRTMEAVAIGVSSRRYARSLDDLPPTIEERSTAKSSVSRRFVARSAALLDEWLGRPLDELELTVVMIDGIFFDERCVLIALGIDTQGRKHVLGLHEGSTENASVARALIGNLIDRGLDSSKPMLFAIDGGKGVRSAIRSFWEERAVIQRCQVHKRRNVADHLPQDARGRAMAAMKRAYDSADYAKAKGQLERLAASLEREHPGAAASLREGLEETLTLQRLGITGPLYRTLRSTNSIENMNGSVTDFTHNVKRWQGGKMVLRWIGSALHEAQGHFRRIRGHKDLPKLVAALTSAGKELDKKVKRAA